MLSEEKKEKCPPSLGIFNQKLLSERDSIVIFLEKSRIHFIFAALKHFCHLEIMLKLSNNVLRLKVFEQGVCPS